LISDRPLLVEKFVLGRPVHTHRRPLAHDGLDGAEGTLRGHGSAMVTR
jgi:hypothetical protein